MKDYYDRRAPEYDDWYEDTGLFAPRDRPGWKDEREVLLQLVAGLSPVRVLDVACGTGYLTRHLRGSVVGFDQSPAMLARARTQAPGARLVRGDALVLPFPDASFERVFTAHFYGHLLAGDREAFLREARAIAGELVVVDAATRGGPPREEFQDRVLGDGSRHRVYKRFFAGANLAAELGGGRVIHEGHWFVAVSSTGGPNARSRAPQEGFGD